MKESGQIWGWVKTLFLSCVLSVILFFLCAFILYRIKGSTELAGKMVLGIYLLSCMLGGFLNGRRVGKRRLVCGLATGALYFAILFVISWTFRTSDTGMLAGLLAPLIVCLGGGAAGSIIS